MMNLGRLASLIIVIFLIGCRNADNSQNQTPNLKAKKSTDTEIAELNKYYKENPTTQAEIEENQIIDYAVEKELPMQRTERGIYYLETEEGKGPNLKYGEQVKVHYRTFDLNGKEYDSSYSRGVPIDFQIGQMVAGFNEGLTKLKSASKGIIIVPSRFAYGENGNSIVPPNTVLVFEVFVIF